MSGVNQTEFARISGYAKSYVTQLKQDGRLVLNDDGSIDPDSSIARIAETSDPARTGVAERHAAGRRGKSRAGSANETDLDGNEVHGAAEKTGMGYKYHQERKMKADADMAEVELAEKQRHLIPIESAEFAIADLAAAVRSRLEILPPRLAPALANIGDAAELETRLVEAIEEELIQLSKHLSRVSREIVGES
jgi:phage terminase Nu1 subunit (DNA packaging protein)